jgi:hypothetical protein
LLVSAVIVDARKFYVAAIAKITTPALETRTIMAAVPADANTLSLCPFGNAFADGIDDARNFMARSAGILNSGQEAFDR